MCFSQVSPAFSCRFSRSWLGGLSEWISFFGKAKVEHNAKKFKRSTAISTSTSVDFSSSDATETSTSSILQSQNSVTENISDMVPKTPQSTSPRHGDSSLSYGGHTVPSYLEVCLSSPGASPSRRPSANPKLSIVNDQISGEDHSSQGSAKNSEPSDKLDACGNLPHAALREAGKCQQNTNTLGRRLMDSDLISISIRCEKMGITDMEAEMLAAWLEEHKESVNCAKLWLFDNKLTDLGAKSVTNMMHNGEGKMSRSKQTWHILNGDTQVSAMHIFLLLTDLIVTKNCYYTHPTFSGYTLPAG